MALPSCAEMRKDLRLLAHLAPEVSKTVGAVRKEGVIRLEVKAGDLASEF